MNRVQGIILIIVAVFLAISLFSYSSADQPDSLVIPATEGYQNLCGKWGAYAASALYRGFGCSAYLLFVPLVVLIYYRWHNRPLDQLFLRALGLILIFAGTAGIACLKMTGTWEGPMIGPGGYLGATIVYFLNGYFSATGMMIIFVCFLLSGLVLACDYLIMRIVLWCSGLQPISNGDTRNFEKRKVAHKSNTGPSVATLRPIKNRVAEIDEIDEEEVASDQETEDEDTGEIDEEEIEEDEDWDEESDDEYEEEEEFEDADNESDGEFGDEEPHEETVERPTQKSKGLIRWLKIKRPKEETEREKIVADDQQDAEELEDEETEFDEPEYDLPSIDLLIESERHDDHQQMQIARRQSKQLEEAFKAFGLNVKVVDIQCGPVIAQFEVELERGLRLNKITNLTDDLAIALRVPTVRIVAPIPGKNTVGVEVPNATRQLVRLREVIEQTPEKVKSKAAIPIFLGKDVAGAPMMIDLAKMPHLLIAGRTGTGKSVCLNSIIVSILMTKTPDECRMIMIDPKMVELSSYESIPHLMHPVVIDMKKAEAILAWAVDKMEQRYKILNRAKVRQLSEYNALNEEELYRRVNHPNPITQEEWDETPRSMPYMVIVVDEMADLMMTSAKEVETHIIRIAQKSRAVGIHLVLATQKPTVDIITGLIKSNLPARIAFEVATRTDSQVVLDRNGAEKLLGNGDMLFLKPGTSQVLRGQGTYVSDPEINDVIAKIATDSPDYVVELVELQTGDEANDNLMVDPRDELFNEAAEYIIREGRGSVSLLQRKFKIGYGRAARLVDFMEEDGIVGPSKGSQPRDVILTLQQWRGRLAELENAFNASKAVDKLPEQRRAATPPHHMPKPKGPERQPPDETTPRRSPEPEQYEIDDTSLDRLPLDGVRNRQHGKHESGRDATPKIRQKPEKNVEQGLGPIADVDDSMLAEVQPNARRRNLVPKRKEPERDEEDFDEYGEYEHEDNETPSFDVYDGGDYGDEDYDVEDDDPENDLRKDVNMFGVVPVADGDVPFDTDDDQWEYEYEYVYEEVDADDDGNHDGIDDRSEEEPYDDDIDPKQHYVEEVNLEAGGDWESEEDWDDDEIEDDEPDDETYDEEEYDEYEYEEYDDWDEDESDERK